MKKILLSLALLLFFSAPVQADFFPSCSALDQHSGSTENEKFNTLISQQQEEFFKTVQSLDSFDNCDKHSIKKYQKLLKTMNTELFFGIENFLGSSSAFYNNTCQQKDSEKLLALIDIFEDVIFESVQQCKKVEPLVKIKNDTALFMQYIRDHDDSLASNTIQNHPFSYYWDEELYKSNSLSCPTENWKEVAREWCKLQENWESFENTAQKMVGLEDLTAEEKLLKEQKDQQLKARAKTEAQSYIRANLPDFLALKNEKTDLKDSNENDTALSILFAPLLNSWDNLASKFYSSSNSQDILASQDQSTIDTIKLFELESILSDISNNYGKSSQAQLYLEKEIYSLSASVKNTTDKTLKRNLYDFVDALKDTEAKNRQCKVSIPL